MPKTADQAILEVLAAHSGLAALVGTEIQPVEATQGTPIPMLTFQVISSVPANTHGEGSTDSRLDEVRVQLTALALTQLAAANIIYQARLALEASSLKAVMVSERALGRADLANCHGRAADFHLWNNPDA